MSRFNNATMIAGLLGSTILVSQAAAAAANFATADTDAMQVAEMQAEQDGLLGEIIVTARRRSEGIQETPVAITAVDGDNLAASQSTSITDLSNLAPSLTINSSSAFSGSSQTISVFMRGIGQTDFTLNTDPGVGFYVDGVYISRSVGALIDLVDIDQVEVLRGPQGTLFGRNSVGGAFNITTKRPADELGGKLSVSTGSDDMLILSGTIDVPLTDTLFSKLTIQRNRRDGYVRRLPDDRMMGDKDNISGRYSLLWEAGPDTEFLLNTDYSRSRENGSPLVLQTVNPGAAFATVHNLVVAPQINPALAGVPGGCTTPAGAAVGGTACYNQQWLPPDGYSTYASDRSYSNAEVWGTALTASHTLSDSFSVKSITAYRDLDSSFARDGDGSPLKVNSTEDVFKYHQVSQELQLAGTDLLDDRLDFILGGFFFDERGDNPSVVTFPWVSFSSGGKVQSRSVAVYGQTTYELTPEWFLTAGLRYSDDRRKFTPDQFILSTFNVPFLPPVLNFTPGQPLTSPDKVKTSASKVTPMVNISYRPTSDIMFYSTYSTGFKSGGFTQRIFPAVASPPEFGPETVKVYEVGTKMDLFNRHLRLNGAGYLTDYNDLQITVPVGVAPTTQNAAKARIKGFEAEATVVPVEGLFATASVGYIDAYYRSLDARVSPTITLDNAFPGTSKWTVNSSISYNVDVTEDWVVTPRVAWSYRSRYYFDAENLVGQSGYSTIDASVTIADEARGWSLAVFGKNLTDKYYAVAGEQILEPVGFRMITPARGAEWGLRLEKTF